MGRTVELLQRLRAATIAISESIGTGQGALVVDSNHVFADAAARDTYFDSPDPHLDELENNATYIIVGSGFQLWQGATNPASYLNTNWLDVTGLIRGPQGNAGTNGVDGTDGTNGTDGADGRTILNGIVDPLVGDGVDGDFFINTNTNTIFGPKAGTWPAGVSLVGPEGPSGIFEDVTFNTALTLNPANLSTYNQKNVIYNGASLQTVTLDDIANFIADPETNIVYRIINNSPAALTITAASGETFGNTNAQSISLNRGQSLTIKAPLAASTRWDLLAGQTNISGGTTPLRPDPTPTTGDVVLQVAMWDPNGGTFPAGANSGFLYQVSRPGTIDGEQFFIDDLLLAITDSASTTVFAGNWHRIDGDQYVHTWGGLSGIIDDDSIKTVLARLGFTTSTTFAAPSAHNFTIDIPSRVDVGTDLNVNHIVTYDVTNRQNISSVALVVTIGDNITLTTPTRDGTQTQTVGITGTNTASPSTITFVVRITDTQNGTHDSNTISITVANPVVNEQTHFGFILSTETETDIDFVADDIEARDQADGNYTVSGIPNDSNVYRLYWAVPTSVGSITSVTQGSSFPLTSQFTNIPNVNIGGETYNVFLMNVANAVNHNYNGTVLTVS